MVFPFVRRLLNFYLRRIVSKVRTGKRFIVIQGVINSFPISIMGNVARILFIVKVKAIRRRRCQNYRGVHPASSRNCIRQNLIFCSQSFGLSSAIRRPRERDPIGLFRIPLFNTCVRCKEGSTTMAYQRATFVRVRIFSGVHVRDKGRPTRVISLMGQYSIRRGGILVILTPICVRAKG